MQVRNRPNSARGRLIRIAGTAVAVLAIVAPGSSAETVDHGPAGAGIRCSDRTDVDTTCLLPFGAPATAPTAITSIALGDTEPSDLRIATPDSSAAGEWTLRPVGGSNVVWAKRGNTSGNGLVVDTAIALDTGDVLVVLDPLVRSGGPVIDLDALPAGTTTLGARVRNRQPVPLEGTGAITVEPDADRDGWGDATQDLCPGVAGPTCAPGSSTVTISGPTYWPALDDVRVTWTVTNTGTTPQPFVLNGTSRTLVDTIEGPPGTVCAPGRTRDPSAATIPYASRSLLLQNVMERLRQQQQPTTVASTYTGENEPTAKSGITCRLPVLAPGASISGTIGGSGWVPTAYDGIWVEAMHRFFVYDAGRQASQRASYATAKLTRNPATRPTRAWKAEDLSAEGKATPSGVLRVSTLQAQGPPNGAKAVINGSLRSAIGDVLLAKAVATKAVGVGKRATLRFRFSQAGLRWLAKHPRSASVRAVFTSEFPRELPNKSSALIDLRRSAGFKRKLAKLAAKGTRR